MRTNRLIGVAVVIALAHAMKAEQEKGQEQQHVFQGTWLVRGCQIDGKPADAPELEYTFPKAKYKIRNKTEQVVAEGTWEIAGQGRVLLTTVGKNGKVFRANCLYEVRDGILRICYSRSQISWPSRIESRRGAYLFELARKR